MFDIDRFISLEAAVKSVYGMSLICRKQAGYGVILAIMSNDHNPPHFHVFLDSRNSITVCRYVLTRKAPSSIHDLVLYSGDSDKELTRKLKQNIVDWANATYIGSDEVDTSRTNWMHAKDVWVDNQGPSVFP